MPGFKGKPDFTSFVFRTAITQAKPSVPSLDMDEHVSSHKEHEDYSSGCTSLNITDLFGTFAPRSSDFTLRVVHFANDDYFVGLVI